MRTTLLLTGFALLGLMAVPPSSALSSDRAELPEVPCTHEGDSTLDDVINATFQVACIARQLGQNELDRLDEDKETVLELINPVLEAAKDICENRLGEEPCAVLDEIIYLHINPNVHQWEWQAQDLPDANA